MTDTNHTPTRILRRKQVEVKTGLSRSTIYARVANNTFPRPIKLGTSRAVGWLESEIESWLYTRIEERRHSI
jgi:prophage regulatory protein